MILLKLALGGEPMVEVATVKRSPFEKQLVCAPGDRLGCRRERRPVNVRLFLQPRACTAPRRG